jgi:uncharacterized DUF497 family protein
MDWQRYSLFIQGNLRLPQEGRLFASIQGDSVLRIISARKTTRKEVRFYEGGM